MAKKHVNGAKLVIVESPTKAKTIRKFLGNDFVIESCMGHVRDLPQSAKDIPEKFKKQKWAQLGVNVEKHFEPLYTIPKNKTKIVKELKEKLEGASELYLATDEDREGESISWHLKEILKPTVPIKRMVFHEITKEAITNALKETRDIDMNLVRAQEARRILDRLVGYTISPLLWKKIAYGLSAGRVQSVALRLVAEREHQRILFKKADYWGVSAQLSKDNVEFESKIQSYKNQRVATGKDFNGLTGKLTSDKNIVLLDQKKAHDIINEVQKKPWVTSEVEERPVFRKPAPPFITSTLQQEANRKLGLSSRETMQMAQKLYEQGFITYMRTDSTFLSNEAIHASRDLISERFGKEYLPPQPRFYTAKKSKGAQEAHEAIRPAGRNFIDPADTGLSGKLIDLYEMIWKRTLASQMVDAHQKQVSVKIQAGEAVFSSHGLTIEFPGFLRAYVEGSDDPEADLSEKEVRLPKLKEKDQLMVKNVEPTSHETKPPARYTEASLVQTMEKEGIGRPSTYASIIGTIVDRGYVRKEGSALVPTFTALVVAKLLSQYLPEYVDLKFTSGMELSLDTIAEGDLESEKYLASIYGGPKGLKASVDLQEKKIDPKEARTIKIEGLDKYSFHVGRYGAYVTTKRGKDEVSASIPEKESPADMTAEEVEKLIDQKINGADSLGKDPQTGLPIYVLTGRFGPYVQLGDVSEENDKPKRSSIPPGVDPAQVDLTKALELLSLPKILGVHPETKKEIKAGLGRFGPYIVHDGDYRSIPKTESIFTISLQTALDLLSMPKKGRGRATPIKEFETHPQTKTPIQLMSGKYGPYLKSGKINVSLPEGTAPEQVTFDMAVELISSKIGGAGAVKANKTDGATKKFKKPLKKPVTAKALGVRRVIAKKKKKK